MDWFEKIEDIERIATITVDDVVFDVGNFTAIEVKVFHHVTKVVIGTYTLAAGTVETPAPTTNGQIRFVVTKEQAAASKRGKYLYQIHTEEVDADFPDNVRERSFTGWCFGLKHAV